MPDCPGAALLDIRDVVRVFDVTGLVTQLLESREDRRLEGLLKQLGRQDLLILDEMGYVA